jgi:hypothetical protein
MITGTPNLPGIAITGPVCACAGAASVAAQTAAMIKRARMKWQCTFVKLNFLNNESAEGKRLTRA